MRAITQSWVLFLWMHALTLVKSQDCTLAQFLNGSLYDSNFDTTELELTYSDGKQVRVGCNVGFTGFFKLVCKAGVWDSRGTNCQPRSCGHPGDAQFSDFHLDKGEDFVFGSEVVYTCHKGYQMVSRRNYRRCMAEGWDGVIPVCEALQCPVIRVDANVMVTGDLEASTYGNVLRFSCRSSTEIPDGVTEIFCDENGQWSGPAPKCIAIKCEVPVIENGFVIGDKQTYAEEEVLYFDCNPKFIRTENRPVKCTKTGNKAEFIPTPECDPIKCRLTLTRIGGIVYEPAARSVFSPGETLRVTCDDRYWVFEQRKTSHVFTCREDGTWVTQPVCKEIICIHPRDPNLYNWGGRSWLQKKLDDTADYSCRTGYKRTGGTRLATCTRNGWTPNPLCEAITCDRKDVENAEITRNNQDTYSYGDQVRYTCKKGFTGQFMLTCRESGWYGNPRCQEKPCERIEIADAQTWSQQTWFNHNQRVQYVCNNDNERRFMITCGPNGWTGIQSCTECQKPQIQNGFAVGPYDGTLYYACEEGFKFSTKGWWQEAKCNNGRWDRLQPCIDNKKCGKIPEIPNAELPRSTQDHNEGHGIFIRCKAGYHANVNHMRCHEGEWRIDVPSLKTICTPIDNYCSHPPKVENAVIVTPYQTEYLSNSRVTYQCRDQYTMDGDDSVICNNGKWEMNNLACTWYCSRPNDASRTITFTVDKRMYPSGEVLEYQCPDTGVKTGGSATCVNGVWSQPIECKAPTQEQ